MAVVLDLLRHEHFDTRVMIESFDWRALLLVQKLGPQILRDMGYFVAQNKNEKLKAAMVKQKLESFIPDAEQLKQMNKQLDELRKQGGQPSSGSTSPTPPATTPSSSPAAPALRP